MPNLPRCVRGDSAAEKGEAIFVRRHVGCDGPLNGAPVSHDFATLGFYVGGSSRVEQRATWTLERGDLLIIPAGEPHRMIEGRRPELWGLGFCVPCFSAEATAALLEPFERVRDGAAPVVRIAAERRAFLASLFQELSASPAVVGVEATVQLSLLTLILSEVTRASVWASAARPERSIVSQSLRYIERHCFEPLTLNQVAAAVKRTPSYVTTALTRATGRSAVAWIIAGRMAEARRRLLHSDERVEIIAERVGYADATHFIRLFRRTHGATPAAWRERRLAAHSSR